MERNADGVCYWTPREGCWSGTFCDSTRQEAIEDCLAFAVDLHGEPELPAGGRVVRVRLDPCEPDELEAT